MHPAKKFTLVCIRPSIFGGKRPSTSETPSEHGKLVKSIRQTWLWRHTWRHTCLRTPVSTRVPLFLGDTSTVPLVAPAATGALLVVIADDKKPASLRSRAGASSAAGEQAAARRAEPRRGRPGAGPRGRGHAGARSAAARGSRTGLTPSVFTRQGDVISLTHSSHATTHRTWVL